MFKTSNPFDDENQYDAGSFTSPRRVPHRPSSSRSLSIGPLTASEAGSEASSVIEPVQEKHNITAEPPFNEKQPVQDPSAESPPSPDSDKENIAVRALKWPFRRLKRSYVLHDVPTILPSPPDDKEKYSYVSMNRKFLLVFDLLSALAISVAMWLFVKSGPAFYWYSIYALLVFLVLFPCYTISVLGKSFSRQEHEEILKKVNLAQENAPTVDIFLPVCKEDSEVLENTWSYIKKLQYFDRKLKVYVLDDGAEQRVSELADKYGFLYVVRDDRPHLKKAGNIRWAFARTSGDYFVIFDADFCPRSDFLLETIPRAEGDPKAAIIQTPQFFRSTPDQSWVEQGAGPPQEYFYRVVETTRDHWGAAVCVGSNAVYRRTALAEIGGAAEIDSSEDIFTGIELIRRSWKVRYVPLVLACGVCPNTMRSFFAQQTRWCSGTTTMISNLAFWRSKLSFGQRACYILGFLFYLLQALGPFLNPLPGPLLLWIAPHWVFYYNAFFAVPCIVYGFIVMPIWARSRFPFCVQYTSVIAAYASLSALIDLVLRRADNWVPSGSNNKSKNTKYRDMRILAWVWTILHYGNLITAVTYRLVTGFTWYQVIPMLVLECLFLVASHRFLLCRD
ncbi:nucleotide-diphospho-sugar transferase [Xylariales sp. PMI_506]|nr:nucleotide-diphospho-sugar transferase [Xylariales sp. PMI_506]